MKSCWMLLLVAGWLVAPALGQDEAQDKPQDGKSSRAGKVGELKVSDRDRGSNYRGRIKQLRRRLNLDEGQQEQFDRIVAEFLEQRPGDADRARQRELMEQMRTARKENDWDRVRELQAELRTTRTGEPLAALYDQLEPILNDEQRATLAELRAATRRGRPRGPLGQLEGLRGELDLNEEQAERYDALYAELEQQLAESRGDSAEVSELIQEIMKATEEGDEKRLRELRDQLPDTRGNSERLIAGFFEQVERFLEPEQKETLVRFQRETRRGRARLTVRDCLQYVRRLDLDQEQRQALREIEAEARQAERAARRDPTAREGLLQEVQEQLRGMLTDEQVAEFDRWLDGRESGGSRRGDHPRGAQRDKRGGAKDKP